MNAILSILREELERLKVAEKSYVRELAKLPKGSVQMKCVKGNMYSYLVCRKGSEVVSQYLGRLADDAVKKLKADIALRKNYEQRLREVRNNRRRLARMIHGRKKAA